MTNGNEFKLGGNSGNIDFTKLKSGVKRSEFEDDKKALQVFDSIDVNSNKTLEANEISFFVDKALATSNDNAVFSKKDAEHVFEEQQKLKVENAQHDVKKEHFKAKDFYAFLSQLKDLSGKGSIKSSTVDDNGTKTLVYEDGAQEVINKDGSKILTTISDGKQIKKHIDKEGKMTSSEILNDEGILEKVEYGADGKPTTFIRSNGKITEYVGITNDVSFGKPLKQVVKLDDGSVETIEYDYKSEKEFVLNSKRQGENYSAKVVDGEVVSYSASKYKNGAKVVTESLNEEGTKTVTFYNKENKAPVYEVISDKSGNRTENLYNEKAKKTQSILTDVNGKQSIANYDGKGNTLVVVQNGETFNKLSKDFDRTKAELLHTNKGQVFFDKNNQPYFKVGQTIKISGEFKPDFEGLQNRYSSDEVKQQYVTDEKDRIKKQLQNKNITQVTVDKDYDNFTKYAETLLKSQGIDNPTKEQISNATNELLVLNGNVIPKKGMTIIRPLSASETTQLEADKKQSNERVERKLNATKEAKDIASNMNELISGNVYDSINTKEFQNELKKVNADNVLEVINEYHSLSMDESLIEAIWDEKTSKALVSDTDARKVAINQVITNLTQRAKASGVDDSRIKQFQEQMNSFSDYKEDSGIAMYGMVQAIEARETLSNAEIAKISQEPFVEQKSDALDLLKDVHSSAKKSYDSHKKTEGWAAEVALVIAKTYNSSNTREKVEGDLKEFNKQINYLDSSKNENEFKSRFKEVYGVDFDPVQVAAYKKKSEEYRVASVRYSTEKYFDSKTAELQNDKPLTAIHVQHPETGEIISTTSKEDVYAQRLNNFAEFLGQGDVNVGIARINEEMKNAGINPENTSLDEKYKFLQDTAKKAKELLHNSTLEATKGKSFVQVQNEYESSYNAAFGTKNDIARRVNDYNNSQDLGASLVKTGAKIASSVVLGILTGGTGFIPLLASATAHTAVSATIELTDRASSEVGLSDEEIGKILKNSAADGLTQFTTSGISKIINGTTWSAGTKYVTDTLAETAVDVLDEYFSEGKITWQNAAMWFAAESLFGLITLRQNLIKDRYDLGDIDDAAVRRQYGSRDSAWLADAEKIEAINPEHSRYQYRTTTGITSNEIGFNGSNVVLDKFDRFDILSTDYHNVKNDVQLLKNDNMSKEFINGLESIEARIIARQGKDAGLFGVDTNHFDALSKSPKAMELGLDKDKTLVSDAYMASRNAYSSKDINEGLSLKNIKNLEKGAVGQGFHAKVFERGDNVIIAFSGSDDMLDIKVDHQMISGHLPDQYAQADAFYRQIREKFPDKQIIVTGHSLGGSLSQMVASTHDDAFAITFDAVGTKNLVNAHGLTDYGNSCNYIINGDVISNAYEHVGYTTRMGVTEGMSPHAITNFDADGFVRHSITEQEFDAKVLKNTDLVSPSGDVLANRNYSTNKHSVVETTTAEATNDWWRKQGYTEPPYLPKTEVKIIELTEPTTFVRVLDGDNSGAYGGWVMRLDDVQGLTPEQIQQKFALKTTPRHIVDVTFEAGTQLRMGDVNPLEAWGKKGGGVQFDLMGKRVGKFDNARTIAEFLKRK